MKIRIEHHRGAGSIVNEPNLKPDYEEILTALEELEEGKLLEYFLGQKQKEITKRIKQLKVKELNTSEIEQIDLLHNTNKTITTISESGEVGNLKRKELAKALGTKNYKKSLSDALNFYIRENLESKGWQKEPKIFKSLDYEDRAWRLDFAKNDICVEVSFNHGEAIAHNILKPVLSSEESSLEKEYTTQIGIVVTATEELKKTGNLDDSAGTFDDFIEYFHPYSFFIRCPMIIIGLEGLETFYIDKKTKMPVELTSQ